jgi:hypothetical protein
VKNEFYQSSKTRMYQELYLREGDLVSGASEKNFKNI